MNLYTIKAQEDCFVGTPMGATDHPKHVKNVIVNAFSMLDISSRIKSSVEHYP